MKIGPVDSGDRPQKPDEEGQRPDVQFKAQRKDDAVEISDSARTLAEQTAPKDDNDTRIADTTASPDEIFEMDIRADRVERARRRAESGYYDRPEIRREIARRITDDFLE